MANRIVTISFTPLDAPGGVPKFNRDLHSAFPDRECLHFSWWDYPWAIEMENVPEWEKARILNHALVQGKRLRPDDVVIADGFWADGLQHMRNVVSHSHGIWSHLTKEDVDAGKPPDMPYHHAAQVAFRRRWIDLGKHITAVSDFIANEMERQWGFKVDRVINNGVDIEVFRPTDRDTGLNDLLIVHGVNDKGNVNKGWDHIELLKKSILGAHVASLDEAQKLLSRYDEPWTKAEALAAADIVVHPSGYEGNSMFVAEALACGVPFVGYDVGFIWTVRKCLGLQVMPREKRSPELMVENVAMVLEAPDLFPVMGEVSRGVAEEYLSIEKFRQNWRQYVEEIER
jgi:glycosyltransferase involved in cell wall biosynthesis